MIQNYRVPTKGSYNPWGPAQTVEEIGAGVLIVTTSGHGGIHVSDAKLALMPEKLRTLSTFYDGGNWFEEDCEVLRVVLAFPELFPESDPELARKTLGSFHPEVLA